MLRLGCVGRGVAWLFMLPSSILGKIVKMAIRKSEQKKTYKQNERNLHRKKIKHVHIK